MTEKSYNSILDFQEMAKNLVAQTTLWEKISQMAYELSAIARLGNWSNKSLHGVACAGKATIFL